MFKKSFVVSLVRILLGEFKSDPFESTSVRDVFEFVIKFVPDSAAFVMASWSRFALVTLVDLPRFRAAKSRFSLTGQVLVGGGMPHLPVETPILLIHE